MKPARRRLDQSETFLTDDELDALMYPLRQSKRRCKALLAMGIAFETTPSGRPMVYRTKANLPRMAAASSLSGPDEVALIKVVNRGKTKKN